MVKKRTPLHCGLIHRVYEFYQFVIFGNSLKNLNLNCKGALYQYMSYLDKNISRRSKQEHDKTGIHRQSNPSKNRPPIFIIIKVRNCLSVMQTPRCLNSKDTAFAANKVSLNTCTVKW